MDRTLLESATVAGAFLVLALPALRSKERGWIVAVAALGFLYPLALFLPIAFPGLDVLGGKWNWTGKVFAILATTLAALLLMLLAKFRRTDFGLTFAQAPRTGRAILFGIVPYLILEGILVWFMAPHETPTLETLGFQATMPGIDEEFFYRGVMLALFDRMFTARASVLGARMGYGALAVTLVFAMDHAVHFDKAAQLQFSLVPGVFAGVTGLVLVWIRARTQSLVWPVLTHNALNLINNILPAFV